MVAVVVPSEKGAKELAAAPDASAELLAKVKAASKARGLSGIETPHAVHVSYEDWTVENGLMTPTAKMQRHALRKAFQRDIDAMYRVIAEREGA